MQPLSPQALLAQLATTPLLGQGRQQHRALCEQLGASLATQPDRAVQMQLIAAQALLRFSEGRPDASERLGEAARRAADAGDTRLATRLRLTQARALASTGRAATAEVLIEDAAEAVRQDPALLPDLQLARAAVGEPEAPQLWLAALDRLPSPARDHDRLEALLGLGLAARDGNDPVRARGHWGRALALAQAHQDPVALHRISALLGHLCLEAGLPDEASRHLRAALDAATTLDDPLPQLSAGTILAAMALHRGDWAEAEALARRNATAASRRNNWSAMADAAITLSTCRLRQADLPGAVQALWETATLLRDLGAAAALNLIKARLAELRLEVGAAAFDPALAKIVRMPRG